MVTQDNHHTLQLDEIDTNIPILPQRPSDSNQYQKKKRAYGTNTNKPSPQLVYPTNGKYSYKNSTRNPTRVFSINEEEITELLECMKGPFGFDMEWRVLMQRHTQRKTALIQICDEKIILLIQVSSMKAFPSKLKEILESPTHIKMGVNVTGDARKLQRDFSIQTAGILELKDAAEHYDPTFFVLGRYITLSNIVAKYLGKELEKGDVRTSNWEAILSEEQMEYAASDAYCALEVYKALREIGNTHGRTYEPTARLRHLPDINKTTSVASSSSRPTYVGGSNSPQPTPDNPTLRPSSADLSARPEKSVRATTGPTVRQREAYVLWYHEQLPLDDICARLRSSEKPLARSTVINYILAALHGDMTLKYKYETLESLVKLDRKTFDYAQRSLYVLQKRSEASQRGWQDMLDLLHDLPQV